MGIPSFEVGFPLRCIQRLSLPYLATQRCNWRYNWYTRGMFDPGPLVLRTNPLKYPTPTADRDRTVSRRSKPSSRTTLIGEQPNPWDLLQPQDVMSRHRGAKLRRRCELLGGISLLSPEYLLSVERWPFHSGPPDHYDLLSYLLEMSLCSQASLCHCTRRLISDQSELTFARLRYSLGGDPPQSNYPPCRVPLPDLREQVRYQITKGWYFKVCSTRTSVPAS